MRLSRLSMGAEGTREGVEWEQRFPNNFTVFFHLDLIQSYWASWREQLIAEMPHADVYQIFFLDGKIILCHEKFCKC